MDRETFTHLAERAARYPNVRRRGQLVRPAVAEPPAPDPVGFFSGLAKRAAVYGGRAET
jgi:hypothetical protein